MVKSDILTKAARWAARTKQSILHPATNKISGSDYDSARVAYMQKLARAAAQRKGPPLLVYQMGKVGSKTVIASLRALTRAGRLDMPIYHVHLLQQTLIDEYLEKRRGFLGTDKQGRLEHIWLYEYLREQLDDRIQGRPSVAHRGGKTGPRWQVVTLTRETVGRNISSFFELMEVEQLDGTTDGTTDISSDPARYRIRSDPDFYGYDLEVDTNHLDALMDLFMKEQNHDEPVEFFDHEMLGVLGIDVYASEFPTSKGYAIYHGELADLLLIRAENLNECASEAFREFLGIPDLPLVNENVGSEKAYASLYKAFRQSVPVPASYVERVYSTQYMRHFYTEDERAAFAQKWLATGGGSRGSAGGSGSAAHFVARPGRGERSES